MDAKTLLGILEFTRARLLGTLDIIEKSGQNVAKVLAWRPGNGRAHIAWQAMHCAATHDKYLNMILKQKAAATAPELVAAYGGGSTPSDGNIPTLAEIRSSLETYYKALKDFVAGLNADQLAAEQPLPGGKGTRKMFDSICLLAWHEAHHQGQIHLTWNLYKAAHGIA